VGVPFLPIIPLCLVRETTVDGFVKSPSAALRFIFPHCSVLLCTPH